MKKNQAVLKFLLIFFGCYIGLTYFYSLYLSVDWSVNSYPDYITHCVALQSQELVKVLGYNASILPSAQEASMLLFVEDELLVRIIEGCNGISIMILFIAFIFAFGGLSKSGVLFILAGSVFIYVINLIRIVILSIGIYEYPAYEDVLHDIIFPAIIYGIVFVLWFVWIKFFALKKKRNE